MVDKLDILPGYTADQTVRLWPVLSRIFYAGSDPRIYLVGRTATVRGLPAGVSLGRTGVHNLDLVFPDELIPDLLKRLTSRGPLPPGPPPRAPWEPYAAVAYPPTRLRINFFSPRPRHSTPPEQIEVRGLELRVQPAAEQAVSLVEDCRKVLLDPPQAVDPKQFHDDPAAPEKSR
jgi:hypothetical protein